MRNLALSIVSDSERLAIALQAPRLRPEPAALKASPDLPPEPAAVPSRQGPARDRSVVGRSLGIRADTSTRHRSRRRRARTLTTRPTTRAGASGAAGSAGRTKRPGRQIRLPVDPALLRPIPSFPVSNSSVPILPVPHAQDRRKVLPAAPVSNLPKRLEPKMSLTKAMPKKMRTADSTLE